MVAGLVVGQWTLTRGLARGTSTPTLGCMYVMATFVPALTGLLLLDEFPRPGTVPLILLGLAIGGVGGGARHPAPLHGNLIAEFAIEPGQRRLAPGATCIIVHVDNANLIATGR